MVEQLEKGGVAADLAEQMHGLAGPRSPASNLVLIDPVEPGHEPRHRRRCHRSGYGQEALRAQPKGTFCGRVGDSGKHDQSDYAPGIAKSPSPRTDMTKFDRSFWEERWSEVLREHAAQRPPNAHLTAEVGTLRPGVALDAGCGHDGDGNRPARIPLRTI